jgi:threonine/homoserine/homoserine lactone efflux protein
MTQLLLKVLPLDLASALSPGIFALALILLGTNIKPKLKTFSLLVGTLIVGVGINLLGFELGQIVDKNSGGSLVSAIIDLIFAIIFIYLAIKALASKDRKIKTHQAEPEHPALKWFLLGIVVNITNFDAIFIALNAAKEVSGSSVVAAQKLILIIVNLLFFTLPVTLPLVFYLIFPGLAGKVLSKVNRFVIKYAPYLIFVLLILIAVLLFSHFVKYFI